MSLIIRIHRWPWAQKKSPSFFRKIFFFSHCPCANLLDFSSSLICLSESAFSQLSCSLPTLKVAPRSAAGPGRRAPRVPAPGRRPSALCLQYAPFPLGEAWEPLHGSELGCRGQRARRWHDVAFARWQGCCRSCCCHYGATRELNAGAAQKSQKSALTSQAPRPSYANLFSHPWSLLVT